MEIQPLCNKTLMKGTDDGFTIVELMIVIVVLGILLGIGIPNFVGLVRNYRIVAQANDLTISLALARSEAIKRGGRVVVCRAPGVDTGSYVCGTDATANWAGGWMVFVDLNSNNIYDDTANGGFAADPLLYVHNSLGGNNTATGNTNVANRVSYTGQGIVGAAGVGAFLIQDGRGAPDGVRLICMGMTGRTRVFSDGTTTCPNIGSSSG